MGHIAEKIWHISFYYHSKSIIHVSLHQTQRSRGGAMQTHTGSWNQAHNAAAAAEVPLMRKQRECKREREREGRQEIDGDRGREITWRGIFIIPVTFSCCFLCERITFLSCSPRVLFTQSLTTLIKVCRLMVFDVRHHFMGCSPTRASDASVNATLAALG